MYVILGASGHTGSIIANALLLKGEKKVRHRARRGGAWSCPIVRQARERSRPT